MEFNISNALGTHWACAIPGEDKKKHLPDVLLNADENIEVEVCVKHLAGLGSVILELQNNATSIVDARIMFDGFCWKYHSLDIRIGERANIVGNVNFENEIVKIQWEVEASREKMEEWAAENLLLDHKKDWWNR